MVDSVIAKFSQATPRVQAPLSRLQDHHDQIASIKTEVARYRREPRLGPDRNPLKWWQQNEDRYPHTSKLAKKYLAIQAPNASSERMNSTLSLTIRNNSARLSPDIVGDIHTLREFFKWTEENPVEYKKFLASQ